MQGRKEQAIQRRQEQASAAEQIQAVYRGHRARSEARQKRDAETVKARGAAGDIAQAVDVSHDTDVDTAVINAVRNWRFKAVNSTVNVKGSVTYYIRAR